MPANIDPVSDAAIQDAYDRLRQRDWPSLAEITANWRRFQLLRAAATQRSRYAQAPPASAPQHSEPMQRRPVRLPANPPTFDSKRAAAGERPDDE